jgi:hypothetical protein
LEMKIDKEKVFTVSKYYITDADENKCYKYFI